MPSPLLTFRISRPSATNTSVKPKALPSVIVWPETADILNRQTHKMYNQEPQGNRQPILRKGAQKSYNSSKSLPNEKHEIRMANNCRDVMMALKTRHENMSDSKRTPCPHPTLATLKRSLANRPVPPANQPINHIDQSIEVNVARNYRMNPTAPQASGRSKTRNLNVTGPNALIVAKMNIEPTACKNDTS